jgi:hypothetical protein
MKSVFEKNKDREGLETPDNKRHNSSPKGKILRVKHGYNPNSSSIGSMVFVLPAALLGITASFGVVAGIIMSAFMKKTGKSNPETEQTDDKTSDMQEQAGAGPKGE